MPTLVQLTADLEREQRSADRRRKEARALAQAVVDDAQRAGRSTLTVDEDRRFQAFLKQSRDAVDELDELEGKLAEARSIAAEEAEVEKAQRDTKPTGAGRPGSDAGDGPAPFVRLADGRPAAVRAGERFADHAVVAEAAAQRATADQHVIGQHGSFGNLVRSMSTTSGSAVVPTLWAADIIDRARNLAAVLRAGAQIVPMDAKVVQIGRLTTDPTSAFRTEGSTVTASDPVFDNVTLTAKTLSALVVGSLEWFQDAPNVDAIVSEAIAASIALTLDQQALFGGVTTGAETGATAFNTTFPSPPNPTGVLATLLASASSSVLGSGANGTTQTAATFWNEIIDTIYQPRLFNEAPNALLWSPTMAKFYAKTYDTTNQPMRQPPDVEQMTKYATAQIPASFTQGTGTTNMSDVFVGDWTQLIIGQRLDVTVQTLVERYAELGQVGIVVHWRGDVAPARPRAFSAYRYLKSN
jgi:HK97 family phage major capsid protein